MNSRRQFLKAAGLLSLSSGLTLSLCSTKRSRPNILLICADDLGWNDVGLYGGDIATPFIDSIGQNGIRFTRFYVTAPVCTPSRFGLLTGRYHYRAPQPFWGALMPGQHDEVKLPEDEKTIADELKKNGYSTALVGKWHLGHGDSGYGPNSHGFDFFYGFKPGCIDFNTHTYKTEPALYRNDEQIEEEGWATDLFTDEALQFIEKQQLNPFFLFLSYNAPHYGKCAEGNLLQSPPGYPDLPEKSKDDRDVYSAMVKNMDDNIGRVLHKLAELQLTKDTIILFLSDNGGSYAYGGNNMPLLGEKGTLWEGGIRVPCCLQWPGQIESGQVRDEPLSALDLFPTLLQFVAVSQPAHAVDGADVSEVLLKDAPLKSRYLYFLYKKQKVVINGDWKYVRDVTGKEYLFNLAEDPSEQKNVAAPLQQATYRLRGQLDSFVLRMRESGEG